MTPNVAVKRGHNDRVLRLAGFDIQPQKIRMTLLEQGLAWTDRIILFGRNDHFFDWYLALNPNGGVPTVAHDRNAIGDSSVINEYLEDVFPERPLRLGKSLEHMRAWRQYFVKCRAAIGLAYFRVDLPHVLGLVSATATAPRLRNHLLSRHARAWTELLIHDERLSWLRSAWSR